MNILVDINHIVDVNFFKNAILKLRSEGHNVQIIFRKRGRLEYVLYHELDSIKIAQFGKHRTGLINKLFFQLLRDFLLIPYIVKNKFDLVISFGATSAIAAYISRIPYLAFDDDFEYKMTFFHANIFATKHIYPDFIEFFNRKTIKYHGFKELSYLHPNYLNVSDKVLEGYSIKTDQYVFVREIANVSLNYKDKTNIIDSIIKEMSKRDLKIILSLENKTLKKYYSSRCIILEEPVEDIYSLIFHSLFTISSGDTVSREAALLGVPTIYTGGRVMMANKPLILLNAIHATTNIHTISRLIREMNKEKKYDLRNKIDYYVNNEWEDTSSVILNCINNFTKD